jgi:hypothetical protein
MHVYLTRDAFDAHAGAAFGFYPPPAPVPAQIICAEEKTGALELLLQRSNGDIMRTELPRNQAELLRAELTLDDLGMLCRQFVYAFDEGGKVYGIVFAQRESTDVGQNRLGETRKHQP